MEIMFEFRQSDADAFFVQDMLYSFFTIVGLVYNSCYLKVIIGFHMESLLCNNRSERFQKSFLSDVDSGSGGGGVGGACTYPLFNTALLGLLELSLIIYASFAAGKILSLVVNRRLRRRVSIFILMVDVFLPSSEGHISRTLSCGDARQGCLRGARVLRLLASAHVRRRLHICGGHLPRG